MQQGRLLCFLIFSLLVSAHVCFQCGKRLNLALYKPATQSSTYFSQSTHVAGSAINAVDGIRTPDYYSCNTCTHTNPENRPWWMVDLGQVYLIQDVVITNRDGVNGDKLRDFVIKVDTSVTQDDMVSPIVFASRTSMQSRGSTENYQYAGGKVLARYVRIELNLFDQLCLCEVQVFGAYTVPCGNFYDAAFIHTWTDNSPRSPAIATITAVAPGSCAVLCQKTDTCTAFAVISLAASSYNCTLFECKDGLAKISTPGTKYYVLNTALDLN